PTGSASTGPRKAFSMMMTTGRGSRRMATENHDPVTGRVTTGHEWNGIEELETPIPRVVIFFLIAGTLFAIGYWLLMPAWPLGWTYTRGLLGIDQRNVVTRQVEQAAVSRAVWTDRIATEDFAAIAADADLMRHVRDTGRTLFVDNCAVCHGVRGTGGPGFPNLAAGSWLWGEIPRQSPKPSKSASIPPMKTRASRR